MIDLIQKHIDIILTSLISGGLAWLFERKRKKAEVQEVESNATKAMQETYNTFVKDMRANYDELKNDYKEVKAKVEILELEVVEWKGKYQSLKEEMQIMENGVNTTSNITGNKKRKL